MRVFNGPPWGLVSSSSEATPTRTKRQLVNSSPTRTDRAGRTRNSSSRVEYSSLLGLSRSPILGDGVGGVTVRSSQQSPEEVTSGVWGLRVVESVVKVCAGDQGDMPTAVAFRTCTA